MCRASIKEDPYLKFMQSDSPDQLGPKTLGRLYTTDTHTHHILGLGKKQEDFVAVVLLLFKFKHKKWQLRQVTVCNMILLLYLWF